MKKTHLLPIFLYLLSLGSCQKEVSEQTSGTQVDTNTQVDIYVFGWESGGTNSIPKYWKNGIEFTIPLPDGSSVRSFAVSGNDIYMAGTTWNGSHKVSTYWKNGKPVYLTDGTHDAYALSIAVSGGDVYVGGGEYNCDNCYLSFIVKYWKNGAAVNVTDGSLDAGIVAFAIAGNDVYAAGAEGDGYLYYTTYWKNGQPVHIAMGAMANSISVSGNDVYVVGTEYHYGNETSARFWKNRTEVHLTDDLNSTANSLTVSGNDVYVCGSEAGIAKYWKNNIPVTLGISTSVATSIAISEKDVYVAGTEGNGSHFVAKYWKNGNPVSLSDGSKDEYTYLIVVVPR